MQSCHEKCDNFKNNQDKSFQKQHLNNKELTIFEAENNVFYAMAKNSLGNFQLAFVIKLNLKDFKRLLTWLIVKVYYLYTLSGS